MFIPLKIPAYPSFTDDELVAFCVANPELGVERDEHGQLYINTALASALISSNNSELIGELGIWNRECKAGKVVDSNGAFFWAIPPCGYRM